MRIVFNGESIWLDEGVSVSRLVDERAASARGVAVAVNAEVVPRSVWPDHHLIDGDRVEILKATQGG